MRTTISIVLLTLIVICVVPVTGKPVTLQPVNARTYWVKGKLFAKKTIKETTVLVSCSGIEDSEMVFNIQVINRSRKTVVVDPGEFYLTWSDGNDDKESYIRWSVLPEKKMKDFDEIIDWEDSNFEKKLSVYKKRQRDYDDQQAVNAGLGCLLMGLGTAAAISDKGDRHSHDDAMESLDDINRDNDRIDTQKYRMEAKMYREMEIHEKNVREIKSERDELKKRLLFKSSLEPKESISGEVHFGDFWDACDLKLSVIINKMTFVFTFKNVTES